MAIIYLMAFASLWFQVDGLYGQGGILPLNSIQNYLHHSAGEEVWWRWPSVLWWRTAVNWGAGDWDLHLLCGLGVFSSLLMLWGALPKVTALVCWVSYLSFVSLGRDFMSFQWDALLLEAGLITLFHHPRDFPKFTLWCYRWLLFRLIFASGLAKVLSGDPHWAKMDALEFHYLTQPLPHFFSWVAHKFSPWFQQFSTVMALLIELILPFLIFSWRRTRLIAFYCLVAFQVLIILTGNYGFFNWLTIVLCLSLVDNVHWQWYFVMGGRGPRPLPRVLKWQTPVVFLLLVFSLFMGTMTTLRLKPFAPWLAPLYRVNYAFHLANSYGLFAMMTTRRFEIDIQGARGEGGPQQWKSYTFKWKPGGEEGHPKFLLFHMPRLDWQMWFASLAHAPPLWFHLFAKRLLQGDESVLGLLEDNPFPNEPPDRFRALLYRYEFSSLDEFLDEGKWWRRRQIRVYLDEMTL